MISIDLNNLFFEKLGKGITKADLLAMKNELMRVKKSFHDSELGFQKLPYNYDDIKNDLDKIDKLAEEMESIVVIGIGGSDLGTRAVQKALNHQYHNQVTKNGKKLYFAGDTTDPEAISDLLDVLNLEKTLFLVVSKSGNTIEQASVFVYVRDLYVNKKADPTKHFVFITDPKTGTLRELSEKSGYQTISIPSDVGGRFSVLSSVGVIPAHLMGVDVEQLLKGARELDEYIYKSDWDKDSILQYVGVKYLYYKGDKKISVMMPYQYSLYEFAKWYQQLWAESLGKKLDNEGQEVYEGMTPVAAVGPVDQHSQLQLYNDGPNDKVFTFIRAEESRKDLKLPENYEGMEPFTFFKGRNFQEILNYEQETTAFALTKNGRPNTTISIPKVDAYHLGQLFYFFEVAVSYFGFLLNINTFDQPGVELSKNAMYGVLGKEGYDKEKAEFEEYKRN